MDTKMDGAKGIPTVEFMKQAKNEENHVKKIYSFHHIIISSTKPT